RRGASHLPAPGAPKCEFILAPALRWTLTRLPLDEEEKTRLEFEAFEAKGFMPNLERLLLALDESANAKFASRLAGIIAGACGIPTTVLHIGPNAQLQEANRSNEHSAESVVTAGAKTMAAAAEKEAKDTPPRRVDVSLPFSPCVLREEALG
ncbi:MAG TPA: hypothetical protein VE398_08060, partial [Acidobacteriota bacterium]|nr:hypothetical protein [Acidobacteriota bacterium]